MPLRDFDQVRERIQLRVEVRHIVQGVLLLVGLVGGAFAGGIWYAKQQPSAPTATAPTSTAAPVAAPTKAVAEAPVIAPRAVETPIVPTPVAQVAANAAVAPEAHEDAASADASDAETPDAGSPAAPEPSPEQLATAPGERAVPPTEEAAAAVVQKPAAPAVVAAVTAPAATVNAPEPAAPPVRVAVIVVPPKPAQPAKTPAPPGLSLFGTLRMAPTVALVAAVPPPTQPKPTPIAPLAAVAAPVVHKPVAHPREDDVRPPPVNGHYVIQVKAFRDEREAKAFEADLRGKGHAPKLTSIEVPEKGTFYRVRLGPFDSLEAARAAQKQFEAAEGHVTILLAVP